MNDARSCPTDPAQQAAAQARYAAEWGLASLLTGGFLLLGAGIMLLFSLNLVHIGLTDGWTSQDVMLTTVASIISLPGVLGLCLVGLFMGVRGTRRSFQHCLPAGLPVAGTLVCLVATLLWIVATAAQIAVIVVLSKRL